ncbi:acetylxylan esterase [Clostridium algoriphilum]|uniref:alpha/beta hydrolase family protein n=1 Tax=Clostridium algoriphilum TaxID=198347 RepID=UPI001CF2FE3C|nr:acetylxylan esterase [Clostridium algoriphilum]MCB2295175.1 acetylxylan esterase [Clostridium algoriphilum]
MGTIMLIIAIITEIVFAVFCICTKSLNKNIRSIMGIGAFAVFVISLLTSVIRWNYRWKCLFALLLVWAIIGSISLIKVKLQNKKTADGKMIVKDSVKVDGRTAKIQYKCRYVIRKAVAMLLLVAIALIPALVFTENEPIGKTGEHKVATAIYTYTDENRIETYTDTGENRKLNVEFWYPEDYDGTYPLVVFSHGSFGIKSSNESLYNELASHGYVVCSIDHTYQCLSTTDVDGNKTSIDKGFMQEIFTQDAHSEKQKCYELYQKWMGIRTGDINFVIDYILAEAEKNDADTVYKLVDTAKIGVMGHSLGGSAALGIGRMRDDISAVIALESPFMCDIEGVKDDEFVFLDEVYPAPVLNVYSDNSWSHLSEWAQYAENYAMLSNTKATAFNVYISGVGHLTLTDLALTSPFLTRFLNRRKSTTDTDYCLKTISKVCLEFFDCYLKGECKFTSGGTY